MRCSQLDEFAPPSLVSPSSAPSQSLGDWSKKPVPTMCGSGKVQRERGRSEAREVAIGEGNGGRGQRGNVQERERARGEVAEEYSIARSFLSNLDGGSNL